MTEPRWRGRAITGWRFRLHEIIYEADTPFGKRFDIFLIWAIVFSVLAVMLESVADIRVMWSAELRVLEWVFTFLFTVEYVLRILCVHRPIRYVLSFYGIVDFLAIVPTYMSVFLPRTRFFLIIRILRLLRIFRVLKLARYLEEGTILARALRASRFKIFVFLYTVVTLVIVVGSLMHVVEGAENGFTSIPRSVYWAIVTMTTVGYGDISPATPLGQVLASVVMIMGYAIIAVPTGIVTAELAHPNLRGVSTQACPSCSRDGHEADAVYCRFCGARL